MTLLQKTLTEAHQSCGIRFEVLVLSQTTEKQLRDQVEARWTQRAWKAPEIVIGIDPAKRHVALGIAPEVQKQPSSQVLENWLQSLQDELLATHYERALTKSVQTLVAILTENKAL